jgi:hypothetical protein
MNHKNFSKLYSYSRVSRYVKAANGDKQKAQRMYYANARIAQSFQPLLSFFEVILRNQLHYALAAYFGDVQWLINQKAGFMSDSSLTHTVKKTKKVVVNDFLKKEVERSERALVIKKRNVTAGRVIAELNLGFWNSLYETHHYALLKGVPCQIFKNLPPGYGRKEVNSTIQEIRTLRNRVSHNEPLCFNGRAFDMAYVKVLYGKICDFLGWINPDIMVSLEMESLDSVCSEISKTEAIIKS